MRAVVVSLFMAGVGVFAGVWSAIWVSRGVYVPALLALGVVLWGLGFALFFLYSTFGAARPWISTGPAGTLLRPERWLDTVYVVATASITLVAALYLAFLAFDMLDSVPAWLMRPSTPIGCAAILLFGLPALYRMSRQGGGGHLRLDPHGFEVWNSQWNSLRRGTWEDIEQIADHPPRGAQPFQDVVVFVLPKGRSAVLVADAITGNRAALQEWVDFYWRHPESRDELVDNRSMRRLEDCLRA